MRVLKNQGRLSWLVGIVMLAPLFGSPSPAHADSDYDAGQSRQFHEDHDERRCRERAPGELVGQVRVSFSCVFFSRSTKTVDSILTLTNTGPTLYGPLVLTIRTKPGVAVVNASNKARDTYSLQVSVPNGSLLRGETAKLTINFVTHDEPEFTPKLTALTGGSAPAGLAITVTSPTAGQTPAGPSFLVTGTLSASGVAGASVDGIPACTVGSMFFINGFQPQVSPTSFTAAATDIDGGQTALSVSIKPNAKGLQVTTSSPCGGLAPLTGRMNVSLITSDGDSIASEKIDFGTGAGPAAVTPGTPVQYSYNNPGLYTVTVTASTLQGASLTQSALISVLAQADAFAPILKNVSLLQSALASGDIARALSYHAYTAQRRYLPLLTQGGINLPALGSLLSTAQPVVLIGDYAEVVVTTGGTNPHLSSVVLVRDNLGIWRVDSW